MVNYAGGFNQSETEILWMNNNHNDCNLFFTAEFKSKKCYYVFFKASFTSYLNPLFLKCH